MELSYSDPKFQIRLTGYADTVIIDSGAQQTISAIRFGGYPPSFGLYRTPYTAVRRWS